MNEVLCFVSADSNRSDETLTLHVSEAEGRIVKENSTGINMSKKEVMKERKSQFISLETGRRKRVLVNCHYYKKSQEGNLSSWKD